MSDRRSFANGNGPADHADQSKAWLAGQQMPPQIQANWIDAPIMGAMLASG